MVRKPIVLVDADGVLYDWEELFTKLLRKSAPDCPLIVKEGDRTSYDLRVPGEDVLRPEVLEVMDSDDFYLNLNPIEGAKEALEWLEERATVFIVTAPWLSSKSCASDKITAIGRDFGEHWKARVILASDKTPVLGDVLIDDKPYITGACKPTWQHVLFDQPYNREVNDKPRMRGWAELEVALSFLAAFQNEEVTA